ncbi:hypothetical protein PUMCH_001338 [Australozyma saopauloensis]|uniref:Holocytochrome c-type synthase n=1 Tax=Australozyma saopauloensis TaxID=291208 RepID=A0AAX4H6K1_9ASCO|nr:hypothetical protein PUMCH_001338 [[Candida] saopauloensis]
MSNEKCPVDHKLREVWASKMKASDSETPAEETPTVCPVDHTARLKWLGNISVNAASTVEAIEEKQDKQGCSSDQLREPAHSSNANLPTEREISSIPKTDDRSNWIYPSQKQFYEAMKRKNWSPDAADMKTIIPIHNQVNEVAWRHIQEWERALLQEAQKKCGGISLTSFKGDLKKMTPRAWFRLNILQQQAPFDRHDWLVDRCGVEVPYVIDFYDAGEKGGVFVDVRPKLQSWEGLKLRVGRALGFM